MAGFAHPCAQLCFPGRFREVWRAAHFSRSLGLKQRLPYVDGTVRVGETRGETVGQVTCPTWGNGEPVCDKGIFWCLYLF